VDGEPFVPTSGPPLLGRHTNEVLSRLGYSTAEIDQLVEDAVVRSNPA
jgi:crotonobetainyl-CoA:carnitine CoA-transferase CaiB-like acyl-CoA transferase